MYSSVASMTRPQQGQPPSPCSPTQTEQAEIEDLDLLARLSHQGAGLMSR